MTSHSYWQQSAAMPRFGRLDADLSVDVAVVGGGITGVTAAYLLQQAGLSVVLLERGRLGGVDTGYTTAHLTSVTDLRISKLISRFGEGAARAVWDAGAAAIDQIDALVRAEQIACDFKWVPGYLHCPPSRTDATARQREIAREALAARQVGVDARALPAVPFWLTPGVEFRHQAIFHPRKYLAALVRLLAARGARIYENSPAEAITPRPMSIKSGNHRIRCAHLVLATHTPLEGKTPLVPALLFQTKLYLYTSYALSARIPSGLSPEACYWDTDDPYHYLRVDRRRGFDYALYGGEDHKTGQVTDTKAVARRLERAFLRHFPKARIEHRWSGQVIQTNDGLPFIGETESRQFAATGYGGNGMTFGTLGAMMAADEILHRRNPWRDLFAVHRRKFLGGTWAYLRENADYPYYMLRDWIGLAQGESLEAVRRNQGKVLNLGGARVAAYRDAEGRLTLRSAVCPHLQCIVAWNDGEGTWDCPCHGSRFKPTGEVISGPAEQPLAEINPASATGHAGAPPRSGARTRRAGRRN